MVARNKSRFLNPHFFVTSTLLLVAIACSSAKFGGGSASSNPGGDPNPSAPPTDSLQNNAGPLPSSIPQCQPGQKQIGAHIAFLVDNSNSNSTTDCPDRKTIGTYGSSELSQCQSQTNREKAVLNAFDSLAAVASTNNGAKESISNIALVSFPGENAWDLGYKTYGNRWFQGSTQERAQVEQSLLFTRKPFGMTPYGSAIEASQKLFNAVNNSPSFAKDGKNRVAIIVSDGEPTDRDPESVLQSADSLRSQGIRVVVIFVNSGSSRQQRATEFKSMLLKIDEDQMKSYGRHWYSSRYPSFDSYMQVILGSGNTQPMAVRVANGNTVEVADSSQLSATIQGILATQAIQCK